MNNFEFEIVQYNFEFNPGNVDFEFIAPSISIYQNQLLSGMQDVEFVDVQQKQVPYFDEEKQKRVNGFLDYSDIQNTPTLPSALDILHWNTAYGWGNHATQGYLKEESDPVWNADKPNYYNKTQARKIARRYSIALS